MSRLRETLASITLMKRHEQTAAMAAFGMVFILMAAYFVLRPVRDAMASDWSDTELSFLWSVQFFLSIGAVALYGLAASRVRLRYLVPGLYGLFSLTFLPFYVVTPGLGAQAVVEKAFYLWVTVFSLLNMSVFWSFMSDTFTRDQAPRIFPFISAGASTGAMIGPSATLVFSQELGLDALMLTASVGLLGVVPSRSTWVRCGPLRTSLRWLRVGETRSAVHGGAGSGTSFRIPT